MATTDQAPVDHDRHRVLTAFWPPALAVAFLWVVLSVDQVYQLDLARFGILPRTFTGLRGIIFAPLIHGGVEHLFSNSVPLLLLGWFTVYFYPKASGRVVFTGWLATGLWVWAMGRESHHIGASGIVYVLAGFLFFSGVIRRRVELMAVSLIVVFLYGSLWWGALPIQAGVSWESHLFGGLMGSLMAWWCRKVAPAHVRPALVYPDEPEEEAEDTGPLEPGDPAEEQEPRNPGVADRLADPMYDPSRTSSTWPWE